MAKAVSFLAGTCWQCAAPIVVGLGGQVNVHRFGGVVTAALCPQAGKGMPTSLRTAWQTARDAERRAGVGPGIGLTEVPALTTTGT